mgnify:CR=1 FL=1
MKSAAPRSGVSDQPNTDALPPKLPKLTKFIKLIEPRARRASPQGHGKSLPDAVKTIDFPSVLEGFRPNPSNRLRPSVRHLFCANTQICDTVVRSELGGLKSAILSITFFSHFQNCDTVVLESGRVLTIFHNCDTVVLDSHQDFPIFSIFPELRYCGAGMIPDFLLLVSLGPWAAWAAWRAWAAWAASAAWVAWAA